MKLNRLVVFTALLASAAAAQAQVSVGTGSSYEKWFYGGTLGVSFGDVEYYEIAPLVGINVNPRTSLGVSLLYRYRKDTRYEDPPINQTLTSNDYGITPFVRFRVTPQFYLQAEYEYLDYEYYVYTSSTTVSKESDTFGSLMAGGGVSQSIGARSSIYATALYNFNYNDTDSPYADPWVIRFGVGVGF